MVAYVCLFVRTFFVFRGRFRIVGELVWDVVVFFEEVENREIFGRGFLRELGLSNVLGFL